MKTHLKPQKTKTQIKHNTVSERNNILTNLTHNSNNITHISFAATKPYPNVWTHLNPPKTKPSFKSHSMCTATTTKNKAKFHFHQRSLIQTQTDLKNTLTQTFQIYKNKNKNHGNQHYPHFI
jgi:hypothetical protein